MGVGYVYIIKNNINNKVYIGSSIYKKRVNDHILLNKNGQKVIKNAILKYGLINFTIKIKEFEINNREELFNFEQKELDKYTFDQTYNIMKKAGGGRLGSKESISREGIEKMRKSMRKSNTKLKKSYIRKTLFEVRDIVTGEVGLFSTLKLAALHFDYSEYTLRGTNQGRYKNPRFIITKKK